MIDNEKKNKVCTYRRNHLKTPMSCKESTFCLEIVRTVNKPSTISNLTTFIE